MVKINILGVGFDKYSLSEFEAKFLDRLKKRQSTLIVTANPEIVMTAKDDPSYREIINNVADYVTADGIGIVKAARMLGKRLPERVTGYDLFTWFLDTANQDKLRVYLIGAKPEVIQAVEKKVKSEYPDIDLVGCEDGYFKDSLETVASRIKAAQPDLVFAALGFPKQERLLAILREEGLAATMMGGGGSFDVFSGMAKRAPKAFQDAHLEWFYRLLKEPTRIGRMMVLPKFVVEVKKSKKK
ncbi:UDP-N-acetyl-D-mannosamine transferase [Lactobacillus equicursoris 66c]|uniref:N-acetylglucosaminyldiphosphoundecaprenol N-acetyl-beta-D-mannosaminyltransferase n=1 Tax=Lactobacillus equicursoris 66c TaxID=872326 RepID=K0NEV4_9LACO|nr:WecB/TagA/CpsF family glycosyltransferase [Lactobacillus equicursoris]CCK83582.1 UDP-N-acetyl-D-mannosamine transferase [Lactobacillus equicursoris 66c]CCK83794.1 UDP-N-acetyl-D-mannosamine transferase [Lactobacillus equicursoris 66c]